MVPKLSEFRKSAAILYIPIVHIIPIIIHVVAAKSSCDANAKQRTET